MRAYAAHWGSLEIGAPEERRVPLRDVIKSELFDTRTFVGRLYAEFTRTGRRAVAARLVEGRSDLPWSIAAGRSAGLTRRSS